MATMIAITLRTRDPKKRILRPETMPCSFPAAISEPAKVTEPISTSSTIGIEMLSARVVPVGALRISASAMAAAAPPPTALNRLTSCGIAVIFTRVAPSTPATLPSATPTARTIQPVAEPDPSIATTSVAMIATAIPDADRRLPRRAVDGVLMRCRPTTKATAASR